MRRIEEEEGEKGKRRHGNERRGQGSVKIQVVRVDSRTNMIMKPPNPSKKRPERNIHKTKGLRNHQGWSFVKPVRLKSRR
jgi:hypothetical protein